MASSAFKIGGVDDAGRGSIIGPLVIAGVSLSSSKLDRLAQIGVRDSKQLSPPLRSKMYPLIIQMADKVVIVKVTPDEVDKYVLAKKKHRKLNYLEAITMGKVIDDLEVEMVYVDASDVNEERFKEDIFEVLRKKIEIISAHHADIIYPIVSAASIIAKVDRDTEIEKLKKQFGNLGSGYPSDPVTRNFLRSWLKSHGQIPDFSRKSWNTWKDLNLNTLDNL